LSRDEEIACIRHVRAGDQQAAAAAKRLVEANLLLVVSIAERYRRAPVSMLKLIQRGNEGLMLTIRTLSESGEHDFSAHVTGHVDRALARFVGPSIRPLGWVVVLKWGSRTLTFLIADSIGPLWRSECQRKRIPYIVHNTRFTQACVECYRIRACSSAAGFANYCCAAI